LFEAFLSILTFGAIRTDAALRYRTGSVRCLRPKTKIPTAMQVSSPMAATSRHLRCMARRTY
jgi:hypothetical protein